MSTDVELVYVHRSETLAVVEHGVSAFSISAATSMRSPNGTANSSVPTMKLDASALFSAMTSILSRLAIFRVMFEIAGVPEETAKEALRLATHKLPVKCKIVSKADLDKEVNGGEA